MTSKIDTIIAYNVNVDLNLISPVCIKQIMYVFAMSNLWHCKLFIGHEEWSLTFKKMTL